MTPVSLLDGGFHTTQGMLMITEEILLKTSDFNNKLLFLQTEVGPLVSAKKQVQRDEIIFVTFISFPHPH